MGWKQLPVLWPLFHTKQLWHNTCAEVARCKGISSSERESTEQWRAVCLTARLHTDPAGHGWHCKNKCNIHLLTQNHQTQWWHQVWRQHDFTSSGFLNAFSGAQQSPPVAAQDLTSVFKAGYLEKRRKGGCSVRKTWQPHKLRLSASQKMQSFWSFFGDINAYDTLFLGAFSLFLKHTFTALIIL